MEYLFHPTQDNIILNQLHFIISSVINTTEVKKGLQKALKKYDCKSAIVSRIDMSKQNCITKEKYLEMYKTNEDSEKRKDLSVGEDLETFIGNIKSGKLKKDTIPEDGDYKLVYNESFLLCLLDEEESNKLEQEDEDFMETFHDFIDPDYRSPDVPAAEWAASESSLKFARSECWRATYFIDA